MSLTGERVATPLGPAPPRQDRDAARWRALLESRWRDRLRELTQLCVTFHKADTADRVAETAQRRLMRQAIRARQALADTDDALRRIAAGTFGYCEDCAAQIPRAVLQRTPEARYCDRCATS